MITLAINPTTEGAGSHEASAAIFRDGTLEFGVEEERFTRQKHGRTFPENAIRSCLDALEIGLADVDRVAVTWIPEESAKKNLRLAVKQPNVPKKVFYTTQSIKEYKIGRSQIRNKLAAIGDPVPPVEPFGHHRCHAASAFYPSGFSEGLVVSVDGRGERESTVVWRAGQDGLTRLRTYEYPNTLGGFYGAVTEFLGYRHNSDEGKVMGLAPYGSHDEEIERRFREVVETGVDYDVSGLNHHAKQSVQKLEELFDRPPKSEPSEFSTWEKNFAHVAQRLLEETVADIVTEYCRREGTGNVALAGGVALNCKMNKRVMELDAVDDLFVQPVANDAGTVIGAGILADGWTESRRMSDVYWGPRYADGAVERALDECKVPYEKPDGIERRVAERLAAGDLVGWFQGGLEMGPRALGNRSILADPRTTASRDRVNEFVKHREEWRPFAPSMLEEAADDYLVDAEHAPFMTKTFDVREEKRDEIPAVIHAGDGTTRPQTVREDQNPRYYELISEFAALTGVPVVLNTSFNDHGEPIVNRPVEAIKDFFGMGLDVLVLEGVVVRKDEVGVERGPALSEPERAT